MEKVSLLTYSLIGMMFLLICLANLSTDQARRERFYLLYFMMLLAFFLLFFTTVNAKDFTIKTWLIPYAIVLSIGFAIPQLISRILIRQKINHPVIFLKKNKVQLLAIIPAVLFLAFAAWIALMPRTIIGKPVYDEFYVLSSFSFLLFFIPLVVLFFEFIVERNALCDNGLYQNGLLSDWSSFRSYFWPQDKLYNDPDIQSLLNHDTLADLELEPKKIFMSKPIRLTIPFDEKNAVENLLSKKIAVKRGQ